MEWFYQIKAKKLQAEEKNEYGGGWNSRWLWPAIFSGKVEADSKEEAKKKIEEKYNRKFPLRVMKKDLGENEFLLSIEKMDQNSYYHSFFEDRSCEICGTKYRMIETYQTNSGGSRSFCSEECKEEARNRFRIEQLSLDGSSPPVIYKITNKKTGMAYIGQTTQPFTLRWYQHFFHGHGTKFHEAIKTSALQDWIFEIVETFSFSKEMRTQDMKAVLDERENFHINELDSVRNGYNTIGKTAKDDSDGLFDAVGAEG